MSFNLICAQKLFPSTDDNKDDIDDTDDDRRRLKEFGRQRVFENKRNQFLVHFYVKLSQNLNEFLDDFCDYFREKYPKNVDFLADRHVTLGDGFRCLKYHEIEEFVRLIETQIDNRYPEQKFCFSSFKLFPNSDRKTFFVAFCHPNPLGTHTPLLTALDALWRHFPNSDVGLKERNICSEDFFVHISVAAVESARHVLGRNLVREMNDRLKDEELVLFSAKELFVSFGGKREKKIVLKDI